MSSWTAASWPGVALGKSVERSGRMTAPVRSPENPPPERVQMTPAHATTGSQRPSGLDNFGDGTAHEVEHVFAELGVDEALELLALGGVPPAARLGRELRAGQHVEEREQAGVRARIRARELLIERQAEHQLCQPVLEIFRQLHALSTSWLSWRPAGCAPARHAAR